jgi:hypothetical protein
MGTATSTATFFRTIGASFGVATLGAVLDNHLIAQFSAHASRATRSLIKGGNIAANPAQINHLPAAERTLFINAFSGGLHLVFLVAVPFAVLAFALGWLVKEIPLRTTAQRQGVDSAEPDPVVVDELTSLA